LTSFKELIKPFLRDHVFAGRSLLFLEEVDSTNRLCMSNPELLKCPGLVVHAKRQTRGMGRMGRKWEQGQGEHLFCSFVLEPPSAIQYPPTLTLLCGLGVSRALKKLGLSDREVSIKWPNDILVGKQKVSGILCQAATVNDRSVIVAGIGVNLKGNASQFSKELSKKVTTLEEHGLYVTAERLLKVLSVEIEKILQDVDQGNIDILLHQWIQEAMCIGRQIYFEKQGRHINGTITGLDSVGRLIVKEGNGKIHVVDSGEIDFDYS